MMMNSVGYEVLLEKNVRPSVHDLKLNQKWVFQQDSDPKHASASTTEFPYFAGEADILHFTRI